MDKIKAFSIATLVFVGWLLFATSTTNPPPEQSRSNITDHILKELSYLDYQTTFSSVRFAGQYRLEFIATDIFLAESPSRTQTVSSQKQIMMRYLQAIRNSGAQEGMTFSVVDPSGDIVANGSWDGVFSFASPP